MKNTNKTDNIGYKLFRVYKRDSSKLYPLYVDADTSVPIGVWVEAKHLEKLENGKVKAKKLKELHFRAGWHLVSDMPYVKHIGVKGEGGSIQYLHKDTIWCEVEYSNEIDYQEEANSNGVNSKGIFVSKNAELDHIPYNGFYRYKTNPNMFGEWIIAGKIKVNRVLTDEEVRIICKEHGYEALPRYGGDIDLSEYGF